jgi:hypothetical protein
MARQFKKRAYGSFSPDILGSGFNPLPEVERPFLDLALF